MLVKAFTVTSLAAVSSAHMIMVSPVPYGKSTLNNSPLDASGSDFPCKMRGNTFAPEGASNVFQQGSKQELQFQGSAVHGGGSCQVSVTTDAEPNKDTKWKVIKSIEGGCPAKNTAGNLGGGSPTTMGGDKYEYTIPSDMPAGNYTLAWTWFNKVGNREMYMNCAPLTVQGSGGSSGFMDTLPDMMVANLKSVGDCSTKEGTDVQFPNPGQDVDRPNGDGALGPPAGNCGGGGGGGGGGAPPTSPVAPYPPPAKPTPGFPNGGSPTVPGGVFITSPAGPGATGSPKAPATPPTPPKNGTGPAPSGGYAVGTPCQSEGNWNCVGGTSFQRCASGTWSAMSAMAEGTKCTPGESAVLGMEAAGKKFRRVRRSARFVY